MRLEPKKNRVVFKEVMNAKNKNNMKRHLHFYQWLLCLLLTMGCHLFAYSQGKVTCLEDLQAGDVIKIYPYGHYDEASMALSCKGDGMDLTSYANAGKGSEWTLIDAGSGYYYLKNELGCYWAYQDYSASHSLTCTTDINSAVKVKLTWDSKNRGVCFWNQKDDKGLNNLYGRNDSYNWYSRSSDYDSDTNTTFGVKVIVYVAIDGIKYSLDVKHKTAKVLENNYEGDVVIPQVVSYNGNEFSVTSLDNQCFYNCSSLTSITLPKGIISVGNSCFSYCSSLSNITLPEGITSLGTSCFENCSSLTSITLPKGITSLGSRCFSGCSSLSNVTLPEGITSVGSYCFRDCSSLGNVTLPEGITSLGGCFFENCTSLTSISFPSSLKDLFYNILKGATQKKRIIINTKTPPVVYAWEPYHFIDSNYTLYIPEGTWAIYNKTSPWDKAGEIYTGKPIESINLPSDMSFVKTEKKKVT